MRVLRTEIYFDADTVTVKFETKLREPNPGVTAAWFRMEDAEPLSIGELESLCDEKYSRIIPKQAADIFDVFADLAVQNVRSERAQDILNEVLAKGGYRVANPGVVEFLLKTDIVLEGSPPFPLPMVKIAKGGAAVVIGTFLGWGIADGNYPLMFVTIPAGIVVIGSAIGISKGLENGLNKWIEGLFKKTRKK